MSNAIKKTAENLNNPVSQKDSELAFAANSRKRLNRELEYRPHTRWLYFATNMAGFILWVIGCIPALDHALRGQYLGALIQFLIGSIAPLALYIQGQILLRPLAFRTVWVEPTKLRLLSADSEIALPYSEIKHLHARANWSGQTFELETAEGKRYRFSSVLERLDYILDSLYYQAPQLLPLQEWPKLRAAVISSDHRWARFYTDTQKPVSFFIKRVFVPAALTYFAAKYWPALSIGNWKALLAFAATCLSVHSLSGLVFFYLCEGVHARALRARLEADANQLRRDMKTESQLSWLAFLLSSLITTAVAAVIAKFYWNAF